MNRNMTAFSFIAVILVLFCSQDGNAFNLSPYPYILLQEPKSSNDGMPKMQRSSYFGFSLNLKQNSVIVGAPRAQSTLDSQQKINETGAIYKCSFNNSGNASCKPFTFDSLDNFSEANNELTFNNEKKDHQWLGASMDGSASDNDKFVVCAPRLISDQTRYSHYLLHGICYWTTNTSTEKPLNVQKIAPLRLRSKQQFRGSDNESYFYYMYGQQGINVHITENEEILIGSPGVFGWRGSVIRHKLKPLDDFGGLSRRRRRGKHEMSEYGSDIPNPSLWGQEYDSYFGFAVSSGYFDRNDKSKLLYIASAPRANLQFGKVYIFDIVNHEEQYTVSEKTIKIYHTFPGQQLGEYFGYSLLTEDFDNDGLTDIAIGAPYNSKNGNYENGAVYIYKNEGTSSNFVLHATLRTDFEFSGRFGTTMSKVGDINQDGFNDLIVAAPFEENGAIYIYLGGANGLSTKHSQRIRAPRSDFTANQMFGHGLSKGADIDGNQYLDIAVGSPNAEAVYVFKSYPVIRINTTITPFSQEIQTTDKSFKFNVCWLYESSFPINFDVRFNATVKLDGQLGRALFSDKRNEYEIDGTITSDEQCILLEAFVTFSIADIFCPIEIEMTHHVPNVRICDESNEENQIEEFCESCVAVNPSDLKYVKNKIVFSTGCSSARCIADLRIKSSLENVPSLPYVIGSSSSITIAYNIDNIGETAYLAQIRITLPDVFFTKIPSNCKLDENVPNSNIMECDLNNGFPMFSGDKTTIKVTVDATKLDGSELIVIGNVLSTGDESNELDNEDVNVIPLKRFSNIEIFGDSLKGHMALQSNVEKENLTHTFEIRNIGPSDIKSMDIIVSLPAAYINPLTLETENLIDISTLSIESTYNGQQFNVEWSQNNTLLALNSAQSEEPLLNHESKTNADGNLSDSQVNSEAIIRIERSFENGKHAYFNQYLEKVVETEPNNSISKSLYQALSGNTLSTNDRILANLPSNRTIYLSCQDVKREFCLNAKFRVSNIKSNNIPISITVNFTMDMTKVGKILTDQKDILVMRTSVDFIKSFDDTTFSMNIIHNQPFTIISKYIKTSTPLWIYIISILVGMMSLILISFAMQKFGFFRRGKRDQLAQLKRESESKSYWIVPGDEGIDL